MNRQTHFLDNSLVYGISDNETDSLRAKKYGLLKFSKVGHQVYLPIDPDVECFKSSSDFCFKGGDIRTTLQPGVLVGQTVYLRLHNYIAKKLYKVNPHWNDDKLFYEARAISTAISQHITYVEYLPLLLGWQFMYDYGILPPTQGYSYDYDPEVKPWTFHEFAGAAFRHHSGIYGKIVLADEYYKAEKALPLEDYYNSGIILKNPYWYDKLVRGFILVPQRKIDEYYDPAVSITCTCIIFLLSLSQYRYLRRINFSLCVYTLYTHMLVSFRCCSKYLQTLFVWLEFGLLDLM